MFGRFEELEVLKNDYESSKSTLIVCYGRRRIGKSFLLDSYTKKINHFKFEGLEAQNSSIQIQSFVKRIIENFKLTSLKAKSIKNWEEALTLLTQNIPNSSKKYIIFFDEFQWMTSGRSLLPALIKKFWDNDWKNKKVQLILCGSVSSYMINKVIKSKALYGRIGLELKIDFLPSRESILFFNKNKSSQEILKYLLVFGGTPKYLADIKQNLSFDQNIANLFFDKHFGYVNEFEKVFYSQFKEHRIYEKIINFLSSGPKNLIMISEHIQMKSGGGLRSYLKNLEDAQFIKGYFPDPQKEKSKTTHFRLIDPFLRFYFSFIYPHKTLIFSSKNSILIMNKICAKKLDTFMGFAFENYCLINALEIAEKLKIDDKVESFGPMTIKNKAQIDLLFFRNDKTIHLIEIKFKQDQIGTEIIIEIEKKVEAIKELYPEYSIQKALVTLSHPHKKLLLSEYFEQIININDWPVKR